MITKAQLIATCNKAFQCSEQDTSTLFDEAILMALDDLSKLEIMRDTDTTQSLVAGGSSLNVPSDMIPGGLVAITLTNAAGTSYKPLLKLKGGLREYRYLLESDSARSRPEFYTEGDGLTWNLWHPADAAYTVAVEYYKSHPSDPNAIIFPDACRNALKAGVVYFESVLRRNKEYQATWAPNYGREYDALRGMFPGQVRGTYDP